MRICVLTGGNGTEREVALVTGVGIANALVRRGHSVALQDLCAPVMEGQGFRRQPFPPYEQGAEGASGSLLGEGVRGLAMQADVVVPALHGGIGEDGTVQMLLDAWGVCYTGSSATACRTTMNKHSTKEKLRAAGIATADWVLYRRGEPLDLARWERTIGYPCVVKPCKGGSSIGVTIAHDRETLQAGLAQAERLEPYVLIERYIAGRELSVGVLGGRALPPVEILPEQGFYDYQHKYLQDTRICCPAALDDVVTERLMQLSRRIFVLLGMRDYGRIDFLLPPNGVPVCLEVNALPGMTDHSLLPLAARTIGLSYDMLCERLVEMARSRV